METRREITHSLRILILAAMEIDEDVAPVHLRNVQLPIDQQLGSYYATDSYPKMWITSDSQEEMIILHTKPEVTPKHQSTVELKNHHQDSKICLDAYKPGRITRMITPSYHTYKPEREIK